MLADSSSPRQHRTLSRPCRGLCMACTGRPVSWQQLGVVAESLEGLRLLEKAESELDDSGGYKRFTSSCTQPVFDH